MSLRVESDIISKFVERADRARHDDLGLVTPGYLCWRAPSDSSNTAPSDSSNTAPSDDSRSITVPSNGSGITFIHIILALYVDVIESIKLLEFTDIVKAIKYLN